MKNQFSIRYKFLAVTTLLLIMCVTTYLLLAIRVFETDKTELVFDYKRSLVSDVSNEAESIFKKAADNMKLVAHFFKNNEGKKIVEEILEGDSDIVYVVASPNFKTFDREYYLNKAFVETYGLSSDYFIKTISEKKPIPLETIQLKGEAIWNATIENGPPLIGFGKSVIEENNRGQPVTQFAIVAFIRPDRLLKTLKQIHLNEVFVLNKNGQILAHSNPYIMFGQNDYSKDTLFKISQEEKLKTSAMKYDKNKMLGAFSKSYNNNIVVISKVSNDKAFAVVNRLVYRSLLFALIVFTTTFIAAVLFSRNLTRPIESLTAGMKKVSEGDLSTQIFIKTKDEIEMLARNFNMMIRDLKQSREKLEEINRDLEKKVKDRTLQLEERNQAVKKAQEALLRTTRLAAVGEIAGQTAHEVLNPLTIMMTKIQKLKNRIEAHQFQESKFVKELCSSWEKEYNEGGFKKLIESWQSQSQVKQSQSLWEEDIENLKNISQSIESEYRSIIDESDFVIREGMRINKIVQNMRSLSAVRGEAKAYSVKKLLNDSAKIMADLASQIEADIKVDALIDCNVMVDEDEFIQVMVNLIRNSLHSIKLQKNIETSLKGIVVLKVVEGNKDITIEVHDNGSGIEKENQKKLFESQFSTKPTHEGTGLGLGISRRLIRAFGGDLFLKESALNVGSTFSLTLPKSDLNEAKVSA